MHEAMLSSRRSGLATVLSVIAAIRHPRPCLTSRSHVSGSAAAASIAGTCPTSTAPAPPATSRPIAPCRSRSMSSIESPPAPMPATSADTFAPPAQPAPPGTVRCWPANSPSDARCARGSTGTSPAADTRLGSSTRADRTGAPRDCTCEMPFVTARTGSYTAPILMPHKGILVQRPAHHLNMHGRSGLRRGVNDRAPVVGVDGKRDVFVGD